MGGRRQMLHKYPNYEGGERLSCEEEGNSNNNKKKRALELRGSEWRSSSDGEVEPRRRVKPSEPAAVHDSRHIIQLTIEHSSNLWRWRRSAEQVDGSICIAPPLLAECFCAARIAVYHASVRVNAQAHFWFGESLSKEFFFKCKSVGVCVCVSVYPLFFRAKV